MYKFVLLIVMLVFGYGGLVYAVPAESRFQKVEKLLTISSAAKRVENSTNNEAKQKLVNAVELFDQAIIASQEDDGARAGMLLDEATNMLFMATRMIEKGGASLKKDMRDFDTRMDSVDALSDAYHNIRKEKGLGEPESSELYPFVQQKISIAKDLKQMNKLIEARKVLDEAYVAAKVAIEHLRGGETLVRSLNFATAEQEFYYEIDRNDTHTMLVKVLLKDKISSSENVKHMVDKFMTKAELLRSKADEQANDGEYESAIDTLEQSTKEIVRAIRSAGIYIPG